MVSVGRPEPLLAITIPPLRSRDPRSFRKCRPKKATTAGAVDGAVRQKPSETAGFPPFNAGDNRSPRPMRSTSDGAKGWQLVEQSAATAPPASGLSSGARIVGIRLSPTPARWSSGTARSTQVLDWRDRLLGRPPPISGERPRRSCGRPWPVPPSTDLIGRGLSAINSPFCAVVGSRRGPCVRSKAMPPGARSGAAPIGRRVRRGRKDCASSTSTGEIRRPHTQFRDAARERPAR
jgi:hypothetical protein